MKTYGQFSGATDCQAVKRFEDWHGSEDVLSLCQECLGGLSLSVKDGIAQGLYQLVKYDSVSASTAPLCIDRGSRRTQAEQQECLKLDSQ